MAEKTQLVSVISKIFKLNKKIRYIAIISDSGKIISSEMKLDKHSLLKQQNEEKFCKDVVKEKNET